MFPLSLKELLPSAAAGAAGTFFICVGSINLCKTDTPGIDYTNGQIIMYCVYLLCCILPFVLVYNQFGFLHSRKKSDFYGSIPKSRFEIFISKFSAVLTAQLVSVLGCFFTVKHLLLKNGMMLPPITNSYLPLSLILISVILCAMSVIAISLSGRLSTSLVLFAALVFSVPAIFASCRDFFIFFAEFRFHCPSPDFTPPLFYRLLSLILTDSPPFGFNNTGMGFDAVFAVVLTLSALFIFEKTKTPAGSGVRRPIVGHICSAALALPFFITIASILLQQLYFRLRYAVIAVLALFIFFFAQFLCRGTLKKLYRTLPALAASFIAACAICGGLSIYAINTAAKPDSPEYIKIKRITDLNYPSDDFNCSAQQDVIGEIKITDTALIEQLMNYPSFGGNAYYYIEYEVYSQNKKSVRCESANKELAQKLICELGKNDLKLPHKKDAAQIMYTPRLVYNDGSGGSHAGRYDGIYIYKDIDELYDCLQSEFAKLSADKKAMVLTENITQKWIQLNNSERLSNYKNNFKLTLKNHRVLELYINTDDFPETKQMLDNLAREELNQYGGKTVEYEIL